MWNLTKQYIKDMWNYLWGLTTIDEKALSAVQEFKTRYRLTAEALKDVAKAIKEVGNQIGDIDDAIMGKKRKGRKKNASK